MTASYIKCREIGKKKWAFLSRNGTNQLRIHAIRFQDEDRAKQVIADNTADNPEWEFKVVPVGN